MPFHAILRQTRSIPLLVATALCVAIAGPARVASQEAEAAGDVAAPGYITFVEGLVTLERDGDAEDAVPNMPVVPGDRLRTAAGRVVLPVRNHGLVKMQPRDPNQNRLSFEPGASPDGAPRNDRADHRALVIDGDSNANARASMRFPPDFTRQQLHTSARSPSEITSMHWTATPPEPERRSVARRRCARATSTRRR